MRHVKRMIALILVTSVLLAGCGDTQPATDDAAELTGREEMTVTVPPNAGNRNMDGAANAKVVFGIPTPEPADTYDSTGRGFSTTTDMVRSVDTTYQDFYFPPGYQFDIERFHDRFDPRAEADDELWQIRYNYTIIVMAQTCAWMEYWLDAQQSDNARATEEAVRMLTEVFPNAFTYRSMQESVTNWGKAAALGDVSTIQSAMQNNLNCGKRYYRPDGSGSSNLAPIDRYAAATPSRARP